MVEISFPLPRAAHVTLHAQLEVASGYTITHLTTTELGQLVHSLSPLGSLVYAMPDFVDRRNALTAPLCSIGSSIDFTTRLAKMVALKTRRPSYVSCSASLASINGDEEIECLTTILRELVATYNVLETVTVEQQTSVVEVTPT